MFIHFSFWKETLPTTEVGDAYYSVNEDHVNYVLALESLPCEKNSWGRMDVIKPVSILEDSKNKREPPSSLQDGPILKQLPELLRYAFLGEKFEFSVIILASLSL